MIDWYWANWADFIAMGGYAVYVWGAYGVAAAVVVAELWALKRRRKALTDLEDDT